MGGGVAGLWLLDELVAHGLDTLLVERSALGAGQTIASQGIIHGGLKYTLDGMFSSDADAIRDMPALWRACLAGQRRPDLSAVQRRADHCHLWRTRSLRSQLGMLGARVGLRVRPEKLPRTDWPEALRGCPGEVFRLDEQVLEPGSLLECLARPHAGRIVRADMKLAHESPGSDGPVIVELRDSNQAMVRLAPRTLVCTAGEGNEELAARLGPTSPAMQRRPLHMVLARGDLPVLNGHCTDGSVTRVTITTVRSEQKGSTTWQIGGQVAEDGVKMGRRELLAHGRRELCEVLPGLSFDQVEWTSYRVDRAEGITPSGRRPKECTVQRFGSVLLAWPTKLALAPRLAEEARGMIQSSRLDAPVQTESWPFRELFAGGWTRPGVAAPPWETESEWSAAR